MDEWKIDGLFMKSLFVLAALWGVIQTIVFFVALIVGFVNTA